MSKQGAIAGYEEGMTWPEFWSLCSRQGLNQSEAGDIWKDIKNGDIDPGSIDEEEPAPDDAEAQLMENEGFDEEDATNTDATGDVEAAGKIDKFDAKEFLENNDSSGDADDETGDEDDDAPDVRQQKTGTDSLGNALNKVYGDVATLDLERGSEEKEEKKTELYQIANDAQLGQSFMHWVNEEVLTDDIEDSPRNKLILAASMTVIMTLAVRPELPTKFYEKVQGDEAPVEEETGDTEPDNEEKEGDEDGS